MALIEDLELANVLDATVGVKEEIMLLGKVELQAALGYEYSTVGMHVVSPVEKKLHEIETKITTESVEIAETKTTKALKYFGIKGDNTETGNKLTNIFDKITTTAESITTTASSISMVAAANISMEAEAVMIIHGEANIDLSADISMLLGSAEISITGDELVDITTELFQSNSGLSIIN